MPNTHKKNNNHKKKILIIEDEKPMLKVLVDKFNREGFHVFEAKDGAEGLKVALKQRPDIILLDLIMPKMDGITMMRKLREENEWARNVPIIILTNLQADDKVMSAVTRDEPSFYLVKTSWTLEDVVRKVKERLGM